MAKTQGNSEIIKENANRSRRIKIAIIKDNEKLRYGK